MQSVDCFAVTEPVLPNRKYSTEIIAELKAESIFGPGWHFGEAQVEKFVHIAFIGSGFSLTEKQAVMIGPDRNIAVGSLFSSGPVSESIIHRRFIRGIYCEQGSLGRFRN